jgi:opacity protein-like surface antigen
MRRAFSALLVVVAWGVASNLSAQNVELGIHAGINLAGAPSVSNLPAEARNGIILGGSASIEIAPPFRLQVEARYVQRGIQFTNTSVSGMPGSTVPTDIYNLNYLEIPVNIRIGFGSTFAVYALAGTNVGTLLSATRELNHTDGASEQIDEKDMLNTTNFALELGGGMSYAVSKHIAIAADVRWDFGLNQIKENAASESLLTRSAWKPQDMQITTGLIFRL